MKEVDGEIKINKIDEFLFMILIYNTLLRMSGFPEDYSLSLFESKVWAIVVVNIIASIVFFIILLRERCIEKKKGL